MKKIKSNKWADKASENMTTWVGSTTSIILHTLFFFFAFTSPLLGIPFDRMLLFLTTAVSLEAIYLAIFIQMTVNRNTESLVEVEEDIDEIQEDIDDIIEDVDEIITDDKDDAKKDEETRDALLNIQSRLENLLKDIDRMKR